jgi:hypothetical protein
MSTTCPQVQVIAPTECIGDSLVKINENFEALRATTCDLVTSPLIITDTSTINLHYNSLTRTLSANLQDESVSTQFIAISAINSSKIADNAVTSGKFADGSVTNLKLENNSVTTNKIFDGAVSPVKLSTGAPFWNGSGYVGIGTQFPQSSLEIVGGIRARGGGPGSNGTSNNGYAFSGNGGDTDSGMFSTSDGLVEFYTNNNETMRLQLGNVGIGTTSPSTRLHVQSTETIARFAGTSTSYNSIDMRLLDASPAVGRGSQLRTTNEFGITLSYYAAFLNTDGSSDVFITTTPTGLRNQDRQVERLRITGTGNVGIGTQSPSSRLDVAGNINTSGNITATGAFLNTTANRVLISDAFQKVAASLVTTAELGYVSGVTSGIQTQINSRVASNAAITGSTKTKITYDSKGLVTAGGDLIASDIPAGIDATKIADGSISNTEFQYLNGATSNIQIQIDNISGVAGAGIPANPAIIASTKTKITYDSKGLVTAGGDLIASDIPSLDASKITSGILPIERGGTGAPDASIARTNLGIFTATTAIAGLVELATNTETAYSESLNAVTPNALYNSGVAAKAWVTFTMRDGGVSGNLRIYKSHNIRNIRVLGAGDYILEFTNNLPDRFYCVTGSLAEQRDAFNNGAFLVNAGATSNSDFPSTSVGSSGNNTTSWKQVNECKVSVAGIAASGGISFNPTEGYFIIFG